MISSRAGRITALLAVTAIAVGACSSSGSSPSASAAASAAAPSVAASAAPPASAPASAAASQSGALKVTFIPKQINNPYFDAAKVGADKAAGELGGTVTQVGPSAATEAQASFIQDETTKGVSAIAISANDPNAVVPALQAAKAAGIKIVGYDSSPAVGAYDVFVNQTDFGLIGQSMRPASRTSTRVCESSVRRLASTDPADPPPTMM